MFLYLELTFGIKITDPATDSGTETYELRTHHFSRAGVWGGGRFGSIKIHQPNGKRIWIHIQRPKTLYLHKTKEMIKY